MGFIARITLLAMLARFRDFARCAQGFITRIAELRTGPECWLKGLLASRIFIPPEVCLQVRSPACVRLSFC
jgi:hypothetical protein